MSLKTFRDCADCPHLAYCDAHVTNGRHKHREGPDPCERANGDSWQEPFH